MNYRKHKLRFSLLMAWREGRAAAGKFAFLVAAVMVGVGALTAVMGFNESVRHTLSREARSLMAADMSVRLGAQPSIEHLSYLEDIKSSGIRTTRVTETVSMASVSGRTPVLVSVKGADLREYPYYGQLKFDPENARLDDTSIAVSNDLLLRLAVQPGDIIRIGEGEFRIAATIIAEPDRMTTGFTLGPRVLFTREGLAATRIISDISRVTERLLLKLPEHQNVGRMREELSTVFGNRARITDFTETNPTLTRVLNRATRFLSMVSLIALMVGGIGVGATMQTHLRQKMTNIAFMKCIGARSEHILHIYFVQTLCLGVVGSLSGIALGAFAQSIFARLVAGYFGIAVLMIWPTTAMAQGMIAGLLTTTLFALPPLLALRKVRPALLLRRDYGNPDGEGLRARLKATILGEDRASFFAATLAVAGLWAIAVWISGSFVYASVFFASLLGAILVLGLFGFLLLAMLRRAGRRKLVSSIPPLRHGLANLYRPGAHAIAILTSLAIGVMFTTTVYFIQHSLLDEIRLAAPPDAPNVFMINITARERDGIAAILQDHPSVIGEQTLAPSVLATLASVDGIPLEELPTPDGGRRFLNTQFVLTWSENVPPATEILEGAWWNGTPGTPLVSVNEHVADALDIGVGSIIEWRTISGPVRARVENLRRTDGVRAGGNNQFILSPGSLEGFTTAYIGSVRVRTGEIGSLQSRIFEQYPTVTVINAADIMEIVQDVVDKTSQAVRFVAAFAIAGALIVLASSVAGTRHRRAREAAIFKAVGATRGMLLRMMLAEFALVGTASGFLGSALATLLSSIFVGELLDVPYRFQWLPVVVATIATAFLTVLAGCAASYGVLGKKPLEILREVE